MDLDRRRLWLAVVSISAYLAHRILLELMLGSGFVARHVLDGIAAWRIGAVVIPGLALFILVRDLKGHQRDWPIERMVAIVATWGLLLHLVNVVRWGIPTAPATYVLYTLLGWIAVIAGTAIWLPGRE